MRDEPKWKADARKAMLDEAERTRPTQAGPFDEVVFNREGELYMIWHRNEDGSPILRPNGARHFTMVLLGLVVRPASE